MKRHRNMQIKSIEKFILTSPKKLREVSFLIKKFSALNAIERLPFIKKDAALVLQKALKTAVANARQAGLNDKELVIKEIQINEGPRMKRFRAGSRGRAKPYKRRMSHIRVVLEGTEVKAPEKKESDLPKAENSSEETKKVEKKTSKLSFGSLFNRKAKKQK